MAGNKHRYRVGTIGRTRRAHRIGLSNRRSDLGIIARFASGYFKQRLPYRHLENSAADIKGQLGHLPWVLNGIDGTVDQGRKRTAFTQQGRVRKAAL